MDGFALFGKVLAVCAAGGSNANDSTAVRFYNAATLEFAAKGGHPSPGVLRVQPVRPPLLREKLEWRPISSKTLVPLGGQRFLVVVVAPSDGDAPDPSRTRAFLTDGSQGVNYRRDTWHQPVLTLGVPMDFVTLWAAPAQNATATWCLSWARSRCVWLCNPQLAVPACRRNSSVTCSASVTTSFFWLIR